MRRAWLPLTPVALLLLAGALVIGREPGDLRQWVRFVIGYQVAGTGLVLAVVWYLRDRQFNRGLILTVCLLGLAMRLAVLPAQRELSDDAARYHWDGKAVAHGINPYLYPPDDPDVVNLWVDAIDERINHPWNRTCYPPLAEGLFSLAYRLTPGRLLGLQGLSLFGELVAWFLIARELARRGLPLNRMLLMVWSPLLICQGYLPGHVDMLTLPLVALLIGTLAKGDSTRQPAWAGTWLALACLVKPLPLLTLPALGRKMGIRRLFGILGAGALIGLVAYAPFRQAGAYLFTSTWLMATDWSFNGSVGRLLEWVLPMRPAHLASGLLTVAGIGLATWRGRGFLDRALGAYLAFVIFTPTLFPWYLISALPLLVLRPLPALWALVMLIPLADLVIIEHQLHSVWREAAWVALTQYVPFYLLLIGPWVVALWNRLPGCRFRQQT